MLPFAPHIFNFKLKLQEVYYEKIIIICVSVLLAAACSLGVAAYAVGRVPAEDDRLTGMSDADAAGEEIIYLDDFWSGAGQASISQMTDPSEVTLQKIYRKSAELVGTGKKVVLDNNLFTDMYRRQNYMDISSVEYDQARLYAASSGDDETDMEKEAYLVFIASVTKYFSEYFYYTDYDYMQKNYNRMQIGAFFFCSDFKDYGYDTIEKYCTALMNNECDPTPNTYYVCFESPAIERITGNTFQAHLNVYEDFKAD